MNVVTCKTSPETVVAPTGQNQQAMGKVISPEMNANEEHKLANVRERKSRGKRLPMMDLRKRSVPCKTGREADRIVDTSVQRMSPENTLRDVPRTMPECNMSYGLADIDPIFTDAQLL